MSIGAKSFEPSNDFQFIPKSSVLPKSGVKAPKFGASVSKGFETINLNLDDDFVPSTPHIHKFRTEMCKQFELTGKCRFGDKVSKC